MGFAGWMGGMLAWGLPAGATEPATDARALVAPLGVDALDQVAELRFTFRVAKNGVEKAARAWAYRPSDGTVVLRDPPTGEPVTFKLGAPATDAEREADAAFINDSFWLLPQLHLRWAGPSVTVVDQGMAPMPVGEGSARRITATWPKDGGGYTPGDAYDLYVDDAGKIVAWTYREGNRPEPSLSTSFEAYTKAGPLTIATAHATADGAFRLTFTDVAVDLRP